MREIRNKKAYFDYEILEKYEAGIELKGFEVKSVKNGKMNLKGSFIITKGGEFFLINAHIPPYQPGNTPSNYDPYRNRKLLLKKREIKSLIGKTKQKGLTLVPLRVYNRDRKIKVEIALAKAKRKHSKKEKIKERDIKREMEREMKEKRQAL